MPPSNDLLSSISTALNSSITNINNLASNSVSNYADLNNALVNKSEIEKGLIDRTVKKQVATEEVIKKLGEVTGIDLGNPESIQMKLLNVASQSFQEGLTADAKLQKNKQVDLLDDPIKWLAAKVENPQLILKRNEAVIRGQDALTNSAALNTDFKASLENYENFRSKVNVATELERKQLAEASLAIQSARDLQAIIDPTAQTVKGQLEANRAMINTLSSIEELKNVDLHRDYLKNTVAKIRRENSPEFIRRQEAIENSRLSIAEKQMKMEELRFEAAQEDRPLEKQQKEQAIEANKLRLEELRRESAPDFINMKNEIMKSQLTNSEKEAELKNLQIDRLNEMKDIEKKLKGYQVEETELDILSKQQSVIANNLKIDSAQDQDAYVNRVINSANSIFERLNMPDRIDNKYALEAMPKDKQAWILGMVGKSSILNGVNPLANADIIGDDPFDAVKNLTAYAPNYQPKDKEVNTLSEIVSIYNNEYTNLEKESALSGKKVDTNRWKAEVISAINKRIESDARNVESGNNNLFAPTPLKDLALASKRVAENPLYKNLQPVLADSSYDNKTESLAKKTIEWAKINQVPIETASKLLGEIVDEQLIYHFNHSGFAKYSLPSQKSYNVILKGEGFFGKDTQYNLKDPAKRSAYLNEIKSRQGTNLNFLINPFTSPILP